jgi:hypothetical protein
VADGPESPPEGNGQEPADPIPPHSPSARGPVPPETGYGAAPPGSVAWTPPPGGYGWAPPPGAWAGPAWTQPRPSSRRRVHLSWLAGLLVGIVVSGLLGFSIGRNGSQIGADLKSDGAAAGASPCPGEAAPAGAGRQLVAQLLPLPRGDTELKGAKYAPHALSLNGYLRLLYAGNPTEGDRLTARCFQAAATRAWSESSGVIVAVYMVRFATSADARSYALAAQAADMADPLNKLHTTVTGVADGMLVQDPTLDKYGNTLSRIIGDKDNVAIIIHVFAPAHLPATSFADSLLRRQSARI